LAVDQVTEINAEAVNRLRDAVVKVEIELGVNPSGEYGTVDARIYAGEVRAGTLQSSITALEIDVTDLEAVVAGLGGGGEGDVQGPVSSTDNSIATFDGTEGDTLQDSGVLVDASQNITNANSIALGATPASQGGVRLTNNIGVYQNNATGTDVLTLNLNGSNVLNVGDGSANMGSIQYQVNSSSYHNFDVDGSTIARVGLTALGLDNNIAIEARDSGDSEDVNVAILDDSDNLLVGQNATVGNLDLRTGTQIRFTTASASTKSLDFDGSNEHVVVPHNAGFDFAASDPFSISAWVKTTDTDGCIAAKMSEGPNSKGYRFDISSGNPRLTVSSNLFSSQRSGHADLAVNDGYWHHIVCTWAGTGVASDIAFFVDGVSITRIWDVTTLISSPANAYELNIGCRGRAGFSYEEFLEATIDDVAVYDSQLDQSEVTEIYGSGAPNTLTSLSTSGNLVCWWKMGDNDTFPTITDNSTNSNDGTMTEMESGDIVTDSPNSGSNTLLTSTASLLTSVLPVAIGSPVASVGGLRMMGNGAVDGRIVFRNKDDNGDIAGLHVDAANYLKIGGAYPTRPTYVSIDGVGGVMLLASGNAYLTVTNTQVACGTPTIRFTGAVTTPVFGQTQHGSGAGVDLTVQAQQGAATFDGGNLILGSGAIGAGGTNEGDIELHIGSLGKRWTIDSGAIDCVGSWYLRRAGVPIARVTTNNVEFFKPIVFDGGMGASSIIQEQHPSAAGVDLTVQAQQGFTGYAGGSLLLIGGDDGSTAGNGGVEIYPGTYGGGTRANMYIGIDSGATAANRAGTIYIDAAGAVQIQDSGTTTLYCSSGVIEIFPDELRFNVTCSSPIILQEDDPTPSVTGDILLIHAQDTTGAGSTGGDLHLRPGDGYTTNGELELQDGGGTPRVRIGSNNVLYLGGNNAIQISSTNFTFNVSSVVFAADVTAPTIYQSQHSSGNGEDLTIQAQQGVTAGGDGGNLVLAAGLDGGSGTDGQVQLHIAGSSRLNVLASQIQLIIPTLQFTSTIVSPIIRQQSTSAGGAVGDLFVINAQDVGGTGDPTGGAITIRSGGDTGAASTNVGSGNVEIYCGAIAGSATAGQLYLGRDAALTLANRAESVWILGKSNIRLQVSNSTQMFIDASAISCSVDTFQFSTNEVSPIFTQAQATGENDGEILTIQAQQGADGYDGGSLLLVSGDTGGSAGSGDVEIYCGTYASGTRGNVYVGVDSGATAANRCNTLTLDGEGSVVHRIGGGQKLYLSSTFLDLNAPTFRFSNGVAGPGINQVTATGDGLTAEPLTIHAQDVSGASDPIGGGIALRSGGDDGGSTDVGSGNVEIYCGAIAASGTRGVIYIGRDAAETAANRPDYTYINAHQTIALQQQGNTKLIIGSTIKPYVDIAFPSNVVTPEIRQITDSADNAVADVFLIHAQDVSGGDPVSDPVGGGLILRSGGSDSASATDVASGNVEIYCGANKGTGTKGNIYFGRDVANTVANRPTSTYLAAGSNVYVDVGANSRWRWTSTIAECYVATLQFKLDVSSPTIRQATATGDGLTAEFLTIHAQDVSGDSSPIGGGLVLRSGGDDSAASTDVDSGNVEIYCGAVKASGTAGNMYLGTDAAKTAANQCLNMTIGAKSTFEYEIGTAQRMYLTNTLFRWNYLPTVEFSYNTVSPVIRHADETTTANGDTLTIHAQNNTNVGSGDGGDIILSAGASTAGTDGYAYLRGDTVLLQNIDGTTTYATFDDENTAIFHTDIEFESSFGPSISHQTATGDGITAETLTIHSQDVSGDSSPIGGGLILRSGGDDTAVSTNVDSGNVEIYCGAIKASGTRGNAYFGVDSGATAENYAENTYIDSYTAVHLRYRGASRVSVHSTKVQLGEDLEFVTSLGAPIIYQGDATGAGVTGEIMTIHAQDVSGASDPIGGNLVLRSGGDNGGSTDVDSGNVEVYCGPIAASGVRGSVYIGIDSAATAANRCKNTIIDSTSNLYIRIAGSSRFNISSTSLSSVVPFQFSATATSPNITQVQHGSTDGVDMLIQAQKGADGYDGGSLLLVSGDTGGSAGSGDVEIYCGTYASGTRGDIHIGSDAAQTAANRADDINLDVQTIIRLKYQTTTQASISSLGFKVVNALFCENIATAAASTYTVASDDVFVHCSYSTTGTQTVTLPTPTGLAGRMVCIKDADGGASGNPITVDAATGNVDGSGAGVTIATDLIGVWFYCDGSGWWSASYLA
jgi:hypothetical protein